MIDFKELARLILQGWCDNNNTAEDERRPLEEYYADLVTTTDDACILALFGHWCNDLLSIFGTAPHIRLTTEISADGKWTVQDVPDPVIQEGTDPKDYYWSSSTYEWDEAKQDMVPRPGEWRIYTEPADRVDEVAA